MSSSDYKWAFHDDGDAIGCARCHAEVPLQLFERIRPDLDPERAGQFIDELLCEVCANSRSSAYPNQRTRAEEVACGAANSVLLALDRAGTHVFPHISERQVFVLDDHDNWQKEK